MSRSRLTLLAVVLAAGCDKPSYISVTVHSADALTVTSFAVDVTAGTTGHVDITPPGGSVAVPPDLTFVLKLDENRSGDVTVGVRAMTADGGEARGVGSVTSVAGSTVPLTIVLYAKEITAFSFKAGDNPGVLGADVTGVISGTNISVTVPYGTDLAAKLTPTITFKGASLAPESGVAQDFSGDVVYTVTAADGSTTTYTVKVTESAPDAKCEDGVRDGAETDVDCGGGSCYACADGASCQIDGDCQSSHCDTSLGKCVPEGCFDGVRDGTETDVDCGGADCPARCEGGQRCVSGGDCASKSCVSVSFTCSP